MRRKNKDGIIKELVRIAKRRMSKEQKSMKRSS